MLVGPKLTVQKRGVTLHRLEEIKHFKPALDVVTDGTNVLWWRDVCTESVLPRCSAHRDQADADGLDLLTLEIGHPVPIRLSKA